MTFSLFAAWVSVVTGVLGIGLGSLGLYVAIVQMRKTRTAAEAAEAAAVRATEQLRNFAELVDVIRLCKMTREAVLSSQHADFVMVAIRLHDVVLALTQIDSATIEAVPQAEIVEAARAASQLHKVFNKFGRETPPPERQNKAHERLCELDVTLHRLESQITRKTRETQSAISTRTS